jgi:hypothetical protein
LMNRVLWEDHESRTSSHDFGKDILPSLISSKTRIYAFPYTGYWMDVGTVNSYWQSHMDLLSPNPPLKLYDRRWVIHTRTEERPPVRFPEESSIYASMITDGCFIEAGARVASSVLSPGVIVRAGAVVRESILLTDCGQTRFRGAERKDWRGRRRRANIVDPGGEEFFIAARPGCRSRLGDQRRCRPFRFRILARDARGARPYKKKA